jgi:nitrate/nitrite-specific signal transduction histidine kinase
VIRQIRWGSLAIKILTWFFIPTAIILSIVALVNYNAYQRVTEELVIARDQELTRLSAGQLATELTEFTDLLSSLAHTAAIYQGDPTAQQDALIGARNQLVNFDAGALIMDTFGTAIAVDPERPGVVGQDWSDRAFYLELLRSRIVGSPQPVISDIVADGPGSAEVIAISVPIVSETNEFMGSITGMFYIGEISVSNFYDGITENQIGKGGSTYLLDGNSRVIYHSDTNRIGEDFSSHVVVQQIQNGQEGAFRTRGVDDLDIVASFAPIPDTNWSLVVEESWVTLTSGSRGYQRSLLLLLVLGVALPAFVVIVGIGRVMRPIEDLISAAQEVASGRFGQTIIAQTGDEIGELAKQFNLMSAQLKESYAHLEQRVTDRTKELATLNTIAAVASHTLDLNELLDDTLEMVLETLGFTSGAIYLMDLNKSELQMASHRGLSEAFRVVVARGIISAKAAETGESIVIDDILETPDPPRQVVDEGYRSLASIPLLAKGQVVGVLTIASPQVRRFSQQDVDLLLSIGNQIAVAIENARLFTSEQRRAEQFSVISEVGGHISSILDVENLLETIVRLLKETFGYYLVTIGLVEGNELVFKAGIKDNWDKPWFRPPPLNIGGEGITAWVASTGEPLLAPDVSQEPRYLLFNNSPETRSELAVPLKIQDAVIGVLNVESDQINDFDETDLVVLQSLANQAAIAIENARLYKHAKELAVMEERQRLARDLHDAVTQTLFSSSLIAEVLPRLWDRDHDEAWRRLEELRQLTRGALAEMRTLLIELRPSDLVEAELSDLLDQLTKATASRARIPITAEVEGDCSPPTEVKVGLYRVAQEALNNVVKHAVASKVRVNLNCKSNRIVLSVIDDGRGFDKSKVPGEKMGLDIMRERVEAIGAELTIESTIGRGTEIKVVWRENNEKT